MAKAKQKDLRLSDICTKKIEYDASCSVHEEEREMYAKMCDMLIAFGSKYCKSEKDLLYERHSKLALQLLQLRRDMFEEHMGLLDNKIKEENGIKHKT